MTRYYIDPPEGYLYGFPAVYDDEKDGSTQEFMRSKGVPEDVIALGFVRYWLADAYEGLDDE